MASIARAWNRWLPFGLLGLAGGVVAAVPHVDGPPPMAPAALEWQAYRVFDSSGSLPQNSVLSLAQDREGFVYAGTEIGLARYDGLRWQPVVLDPAARQAAVGALLGSDDGALWIGADALGLLRLDAGGVRRLRVADGAPPTTVFDIQPIDAREVWVGAADGLYRCAPTACRAIEAARGMPVRVVQPVDGPAGDGLWVGVEGSGLRRLDGALGEQPRWSDFALRRDDGLPNDIVVALHRWGGVEGRDLWIGTGRGFARWDGRRVVSYSARNGLPSSMVFAFANDVDRDGTPVLRAAARPGGLVEVRDDGRWRLAGTREGLPDASVQSLLRERGRGALWLGTLNGGVARSEPGRWITLDERAGLPDRGIVGIGLLDAADASGAPALWVGTARGAVRWAADGFVPLLPPAFADRLVYAAQRMDDGSLWAATERGLLVFEGDRLRAEFTVDNSALPAVWAREIARRRSADGSEELWVGTGHGLARWRAVEGLARVDALPAMPRGASIGRLLVAPGRGAGGGDALWVVAGRRLLRFDGVLWTRHEACTTGAVVEDVAIDAAQDPEHAWLATRDGLVVETRDGQCKRPAAHDDPGAWTHVVRSGDDVFAFGAHGGWHLPQGDPGRGTRFDVVDGLPMREVARGRSVVVDPAGRVFAGTSAGLGALDPAARGAPGEPAPLVLVDARHGADRAPLADGAAIASAQAGVRFAFRLLAFSREHAIRYRTQLLGIDAEASPWTDAAEARYDRLPPGRYNFQAWARDADGVVSGPIARRFSVVAPPWQRPWAFVAYALALLALGLALGRWRARLVAQRARALEQEVATRTRELAQANAQLEQAAVTDPLTGLRNRRFLALGIEQEAERTLRRVVHGEPESDLLLVLVDVDRFKGINDRFGHAAGDQVLVDVSSRLAGLARQGDYVLRWGGEEFLLLLRDCERSHAESALRRVLAGIAGTTVLADGRTIDVTASAGAVAFPLRIDVPRQISLADSIEIADAALYRAKEDGRDRAMIALWDGRREADARGLRLRHQRVLRMPGAPPPG